MTEKMCQDRICVITGAGRGIGREYALMLAAEGAKVVVNDFGGSRDGSGAGGSNPAQDVVDEIVAAGGQAVAHLGDASSLDDAKAMISLAIDTFGGLDVVVNNAGILRDRMLFSMAEEEWDAVIKVHMKGTWASSRVAAEYWRNRSKEGLANDARLINTTSVSGIYGNPGQTNYGAAKAGIATSHSSPPKNSVATASRATLWRPVLSPDSPKISACHPRCSSASGPNGSRR